jgi:hypothetical protein
MHGRALADLVLAGRVLGELVDSEHVGDELGEVGWGVYLRVALAGTVGPQFGQDHAEQVDVVPGVGAGDLQLAGLERGVRGAVCRLDLRWVKKFTTCPPTCKFGT